MKSRALGIKDQWKTKPLALKMDEKPSPWH